MDAERRTQEQAAELSRLRGDPTRAKKPGGLEGMIIHEKKPPKQRSGFRFWGVIYNNIQS